MSLARRISAQALNDALDRPASYTLSVFVMDTRTPKQRRHIMQAVKSKDTKPEMVVRRCLHAMGYRYRLHCKDPLRKPDIAFVGRKTSVGRFSDRQETWHAGIHSLLELRLCWNEC